MVTHFGNFKSPTRISLLLKVPGRHDDTTSKRGGDPVKKNRLKIDTLLFRLLYNLSILTIVSYYIDFSNIYLIVRRVLIFVIKVVPFQRISRIKCKTTTSSRSVVVKSHYGLDGL